MIGSTGETYTAADRASTNVPANGDMPTTMISGILHGFSNVIKGTIKAVVSETVDQRGTKQRFPNPDFQPATRALFNRAKYMTRSVRSRGLSHNFQLAISLLNAFFT